MKPDLIIREATRQDAAVIVHLIRQLGEDSSITEEYVLHYLTGSERHILLAERLGAVQGLMSYSVRADLFHAGDSVLIEELVVDHAARGQGLGGALVDALLEKLAGSDCREVCLAVMTDNADAIRFYKQHGLCEEALFLERHFLA